MPPALLPARPPAVTLARLLLAAVLSAGSPRPALAEGDDDHAHFRFAYPYDLQLVSWERERPYFRLHRFHKRSGERVNGGGVTAWLTAQRLPPEAQPARREIALRYDADYLMEHERLAPAAVEVPLLQSAEAPVLLLQRARRAQASILGASVSEVHAVLGGGELQSAQKEIHLASHPQHGLFVEQWAGRRVSEQGFPSLQWAETVHTHLLKQGPQEGTDEQMHSSTALRLVQVFPAAPGRPARVVERHILSQMRPEPGLVATRTVHVVTEFTRSAAGGLALSLRRESPRAPSGEYDWHRAQGWPDRVEWARLPGFAQPRLRAWESALQPLATHARGIQPLAAVLFLALPAGWAEGRWDGAPLPIAAPVLDRDGQRLYLSEERILPAFCGWHFDAAGDLVASTPLGRADAAQVRENVRALWTAAQGDPRREAEVRHLVTIVVAMASEFPHRPGQGRRTGHVPDVLALVHER